MFGESLSVRALLATLPLLAAVEAQVITTYVPNPNPVCTVQPYVVEYPVHIDTYIAADTAIIINGGVTININNAPTSLVTDVIATSTELVPVATIVPGAPFLLALAPAAPLRKRQTLSAAYVSPAGGVTADCAGAAVFAISNGQLSSGGALVSTGSGIAASAFETTEIVGNISTTFGFSGTTLSWTNAAFSGGAASFCSMPSGEVVAVYSTPAPTGCVAVSLVAVAPSTCISSYNTTSSSTTGPSTSAPSGVNGTVTVTSTTTAPPSTVPTANPADGFVLSFSLGSTKKRQGTTEYINSSGMSTTNVLESAIFNVVDGELLDNELLVSTSVGAAYAVIVGSAAPGTIFTFFEVGTSLTWTNGNFSTTDGIATYCTVPSTLFVYAVFGDVMPDGCVPIVLTAVPVVDTPLGGASSSSSSSAASSTSSTTSISPGSSPSSTSSTTSSTTGTSSSSSSTSSTSTPSGLPTGSSNSTAKMLKRAPKPIAEQYFV